MKENWRARAYCYNGVVTTTVKVVGLSLLGVGIKSGNNSMIGIGCGTIVMGLVSFVYVNTRLYRPFIRREPKIIIQPLTEIKVQTITLTTADIKNGMFKWENDTRRLPDELMVQIFGDLKPKDLASAAKVCKFWYYFIHTTPELHESLVRGASVSIQQGTRWVPFIGSAYCC